MNNERHRKAEKIINLYNNRAYRQEDIAKELGMPIEDVRKVTKAYGYEHTKKKQTDAPNNLNEGQIINPVIFFKDFDFLDKYDI